VLPYRQLRSVAGSTAGQAAEIGSCLLGPARGTELVELLECGGERCSSRAPATRASLDLALDVQRARVLERLRKLLLHLERGCDRAARAVVIPTRGGDEGI